jgi:phosphoglycerate kinase
MNDVSLAGKRVLLRADLNCPVDPKTKKIIDDTRIVALVPTLKDLSRSRVVLIAHQGRPGDDDFIPLDQHTQVLKKLGFKATFIDDIFGERAKAAIQKVKVGDVLVLQNVRYFDGELKTGFPEEMAKEAIVQKLYPLFDFFVNDAFGAAHRGQPSIVGFTAVLPSLAGRIVEKEVRVLTDITGVGKHPWTLVLGGSKVPDKVKILSKLLASGRVDNALIGGLIGNLFLIASGQIGSEHGTKIEDFDKVLVEAKSILQKYPDRIVLPIDAAIDRRGQRVVCGLSEVQTDPLLDIGPKTAEKYVSIIRKSAVVFANGPMGYFEKKDFAEGTNRVLDAIASFGGVSVVGGGHVGALAEEKKLMKQITHISTGGGATIEFLTGRKLQLIDALEKSAQRMSTRPEP